MATKNDDHAEKRNQPHGNGNHKKDHANHNQNKKSHGGDSHEEGKGPEAGHHGYAKHEPHAQHKAEQSHGKKESAGGPQDDLRKEKQSAHEMSGGAKEDSRNEKRSEKKNAAEEGASAEELITRLKKAAGDLESFREELDKGKEAAQEKYEELKKALNAEVVAIQGLMKVGDGKNAGLYSDFSKLQEHLADGKAETLDAFNEQKHRIFAAVDSLDTQLTGSFLTAELREKFRDEIEKFRIKMELLRANYEDGKKAVQEKLKLEERKEQLDEVISKVRKRFEAARDRWNDEKEGRAHELREAYKHLRKAFVPNSQP